MRPVAVKIHPEDNVAVAVEALSKGQDVAVGEVSVRLRDAVPAGHKFALVPIAEGESVRKYGYVLGRAVAPVEPGDWVHVHNLKTLLSGEEPYTFEPVQLDLPEASLAPPTFMGFRRANGRVGTRNEIWVINTVGCVNQAANRIAQTANERYKGVIDGVFSFAHPYGCSQLGDDLNYTQRILAGLMRHPNAGGVLVLGLGCENNRMQALLNEAGPIDPQRIRSFNSQEVDDEIEAGLDAIAALVETMEEDRREPCPISDLVIGLKCGGSDGFSGVTANPLLGRIADRLSAAGGTAVQTEVPEMFGAERQLMNRAADASVFGDMVAMINRFKDYFISHGQVVYENPSPGNKDGGLTTLEEKSLGAIQKGRPRARQRSRRLRAHLPGRTRWSLAHLRAGQRWRLRHGRGGGRCHGGAVYNRPGHAARLPRADAEGVYEHGHRREKAALDRFQRRRAARRLFDNRRHGRRPVQARRGGGLG